MAPTGLLKLERHPSFMAGDPVWVILCQQKEQRSRRSRVRHANQPSRELDLAAVALEAMRKAASLNALESNWQEFLRRTERAWNKLQARFRNHAKWGAWVDSYAKLRRTDPLLSYLINARGADEHTLGEIVEHHPGRLGIGAAEGSSLFIERMLVTDGRVSVQSPQSLRIEFTPAAIRLVPVVNRGRTYPVPTTHLGTPIDPSDILAVAEAALSFYRDAVGDAEGFFFA